VLPGNASNNLWILSSARFIGYTQGGIYIQLLHSQYHSESYCVNSSPAEVLFSCVLLIPILYLLCVLLAASIIHCIYFSSSFILAHTKLADLSAVTLLLTVVELASYSWYNHRTDHRKHLCCHCWHVCTESLHSNGHYDSIVALLSHCLAMLCHPRYNIIHMFTLYIAILKWQMKLQIW
jgi:hypothetical protein